MPMPVTEAPFPVDDTAIFMEEETSADAETGRTLGEDVAATLTGGDGAFQFEGVADRGYTFSLRVDAYDADEDGVYDYQYTEVFLGGLQVRIAGAAPPHVALGVG